MHTKWWQKIAMLVLVLAMPVILFSGNVYFMLSHRFIAYEYKTPDFPLSRKFNLSRQLDLADKVVSYLKKESPDPSLDFLTREEERHLADVRNLFRQIFFSQKIAALLFLIAFLALAVTLPGRRRLLRLISQGGLLTLAIVLLLIAIAQLNFSWLFAHFHRLFFSGNSWLFPPGSTLIQLFPAVFWFDAARILLIITLAESAILAVGLLLWPRKQLNQT